MLCLVLAFLLGYSACIEALDNGVLHDHHSRSGSAKYMQAPLVKTTDPTGPSKKLTRFTETEFLTPKVVKVTDNVYVAIGYALANSIMIEGEKGLIIVDTTESVIGMRVIMEDFRKITKKPVVAVIYTHFHGDHIKGTLAVIEDGKALHPEISIDIYAHKTLYDEVHRFMRTYSTGYSRMIRQLGWVLDSEDVLKTGSGLGPQMRRVGEVIYGDKNLFFNPTVTFATNKAHYSIAGIEVQLLHTPGETDDQITVWIPEYGVAMPGDNIYKTFPNLYAIRGSPTRDTRQWCESLDIVRSLGASFLIGSHTKPVKGKEEVYDTLLVYRDGIKYVHDQTVRLMNKGLHPDDIVDSVKLPERLFNHPHLQQHYGTVEWSVRGVFTNYLGWFNGDPKDLHHLSRTDHAVKMLKLITNAQAKDDCAVEVILQEAQSSHLSSYHQYLATGRHNNADNKWALELVDVVLSLGTIDPELTYAARQIKISALRALGIEQVSANGRNYYLTVAMEMESGNSSVVLSKKERGTIIKNSPTAKVLDILCMKVKGLTCQFKNFTVGLKFVDDGKEYGISLRNSVCDVFNPLPPGMKTSVSMTTTAEVFKSMNVDEERDINKGLVQGTVQITNGKVEIFEEFMQCFDSLTSP